MIKVENRPGNLFDPIVFSVDFIIQSAVELASIRRSPLYAYVEELLLGWGSHSKEKITNGTIGWKNQTGVSNPYTER